MSFKLYILDAGESIELRKLPEQNKIKKMGMFVSVQHHIRI